ncbi:MAG: ABC transporter permease [Planctomycetes bacterium]|nr:ABC transporter permease [Planctomycetota bacterium]
MSRYLSAIWKCRYFWLSLVQMDLRNRYRRSVVGMGWSLLNPIAMTTVICLVFPRFMPQIKSVNHYAPMVLVGLCFWNFISSAARLGTKCLIHSERYIRQYPAPMAIYPLRLALGGAFHFLIALAVVLVMRCCLIGFSDLHTFISLVPTVLMIFVLAWSVSLLVGFATAYFPDIEHLADVGLQILFYATPIVYSPSAIQGKLGLLIRLNPLTTFVELLHAPLIHGQFPDASLFATGLLITAGFAGVSMLTVSRFEKKIIFQL